MGNKRLFTLLKCIGWVVCHFFKTLFTGFVFSNLWRWFVVSTFHLPTLGLASSTGLVLLCEMAGYIFNGTKGPKLTRDDPEKDEDLWRPWISFLTTRFLALLFGWVIHLFM